MFPSFLLFLLPHLLPCGELLNPLGLLLPFFFSSSCLPFSSYFLPLSFPSFFPSCALLVNSISFDRKATRDFFGGYSSVAELLNPLGLLLPFFFSSSFSCFFFLLSSPLSSHPFSLLAILATCFAKGRGKDGGNRSTRTGTPSAFQ